MSIPSEPLVFAMSDWRYCGDGVFAAVVVVALLGVHPLDFLRLFAVQN